MTFIETQLAMGVVYEDIKTISSKLEQSKPELEKTKHQLEICIKAKEESRRKIDRICQAEEVSLPDYVAARKEEDAVLTLWGNTGVHLATLQSGINTLESLKADLEAKYTDLGERLTAAENNVVQIDARRQQNAS